MSKEPKCGYTLHNLWFMENEQIQLERKSNSIYVLVYNFFAIVEKIKLRTKSVYAYSNLKKSAFSAKQFATLQIIGQRKLFLLKDLSIDFNIPLSLVKFLVYVGLTPLFQRGESREGYIRKGFGSRFLPRQWLVWQL